MLLDSSKSQSPKTVKQVIGLDNLLILLLINGNVWAASQVWRSFGSHFSPFILGSDHAIRLFIATTLTCEPSSWPWNNCDISTTVLWKWLRNLSLEEERGFT